mmetsp:Transcript_15355/g.25115  ORF Transcript_15355/g.25115 Transcript_15355/m.25115 type:complete len:188 (-) Transcript_15355:180-743(-)
MVLFCGWMNAFLDSVTCKSWTLRGCAFFYPGYSWYKFWGNDSTARCMSNMMDKSQSWRQSSQKKGRRSTHLAHTCNVLQRHPQCLPSSFFLDTLDTQNPAAEAVFLIIMTFLDEYDGSMRVMRIYGDGGHVVVVVVSRRKLIYLPISISHHQMTMAEEFHCPIYIMYIIINAAISNCVGGHFFYLVY